VAHSLKILHDLHIVHSDLKPSNVLIKRTELGYTTKLIDFDSSYLVGNPPPPEEIVGTMNYYSPELVRYIQETAAPGELTEASDIFALGLIYAEYLTGTVPSFDPAHHEPAIAVLHGQVLELGPSRAPEAVVDIVERMLLLDPAARPGVAEVHSTLMSLRSGSATTPARTRARAPKAVRTPLVPRDAARPPSSAAPVPAAPRPGTAGPPSQLRGKGVRIAGREPAAGAAAPPPPAPAKATPAPPTTERADTSEAGRGRALLGKLMGKLDERRTR
jgi:serine/threonine protein kinase